MREIEFRVYNTTSKEFTYFDTPWITFDAEDKPIVAFKNAKINKAMLGGYCDVEQYVGLKDKNGVKIFEGDIVKVRFRNGCGYIYEIGKIAWNNNNCRFSWFADGGDGWGMQEKDEDNREVIGNIHQSPELCK